MKRIISKEDKKMKRKISNQILSLLLALVMVFVMIPISTLTAISEDLTSITGISITGVPVPVVGERISPMDGSALTESTAHAPLTRWWVRTTLPTL